MRISELLGARVEDRGGRPVGRVVDLRLVQDGPLRFPYGAGLRLDGFIVAQRAPMRLLGYEREVRPAIFRKLVHILSGAVHFVAFGEVEAVAQRPLRIRKSNVELPVLDDVPARRATRA